MTAPEECPNGCALTEYGTHQGPPDCDRLPRDPEWYDPDAPVAAPAATLSGGELALVTYKEPEPPYARLETSPAVRFVIVGKDGTPLLTLDAAERTLTTHESLRTDEAAERFLSAVRLLLGRPT